MTKKYEEGIRAKLKKLRFNNWYAIGHDREDRDDFILVLKCLIDEGYPYQIKGNWEAFQYFTDNVPLWQTLNPLPEGITLKKISETDETEFYIGGRPYLATGPARIEVYRDNKIIAIETLIKKQQ
jgi:hypothetical protein